MSCHTLLRKFTMEFNEIKTRNQLALFLGVPRSKLTYLLYIKGINNCYHSFSIPKKSGGTRTINVPCGELKSIQKTLANILYEYQISIWEMENITPNISHGFTKGKTIFTNAKIHTNKKYVLNIDLENFFDSFHFGRVCGYFEKNKFFDTFHEVATIIAQLTCYKGKLPQGAPTSPIITNLICQILDFRLLHIAKKFHLDYTRYADDLTFSTNDKHFIDLYNNFYSKVKKEICKSGFSINEKKTRLQYKDSKQTVTGLVVNKKPNINRKYYKTTKAMALNLYKNNSFIINGETGDLNQLNGRFSFINQIDKYNNKNDKSNKHNIYCLNSREKEYRKFLFYKNFIATEKPVIVTEGKTDIIYIKAALKNLYINYPNLIKKDSEGNFDFNVSFFTRSKVICYLFGISQDGADAMKNLYNYFSQNSGDKNNFPDYREYFESKFSQTIHHPILFLFDNELSNKNKPLYKFVHHIGIQNDSDEYKSLKNNLFTSIDKGNLFLVTNPLMFGKSECEIEDLFLPETLNHKILDKAFSRNSNFDTSKYYGKDRFSKYIATNYKNIDFTNFKFLLNTINTIIEKE